MADKQKLVSSFLEIIAGESPDFAARYLEGANWCLEDAIEHFLSGDVAGVPAASGDIDVDEEEEQQQEDNDNEDDELPVVHVGPTPLEPWSYYPENMTDSNAAFANGPQQDDVGDMIPSLADMFFWGTFNEAKDAGVRMDQWLLVNVQSGDQSSNLLNGDVWSDATLAYLIADKFIFWQEDRTSFEGKKVCSYYKQDSLPVILVVDPITGKMMRAWTGVVTPEELLEYLLPLSRQSPREHLVATSGKRPSEAAKETPPPDEDSTEGPTDASAIGDLTQRYERLCLAKEPDELDGEDVCRVGVRLPDGRRVQRRFLQRDSIRMLWSFCLHHLDDDDAARGFHFVLAAPGNSKRLAYDSDLSFKEADVSNALMSLVWD